MNAVARASEEPQRKRYRLRPSGCCDMPRIVRLTDAEAAPGLARGMLTPLPDEPASNQTKQPRNTQ